jgi:hypothetical protein
MKGVVGGRDAAFGEPALPQSSRRFLSPPSISVRGRTFGLWMSGGPKPAHTEGSKCER